MDRLSIIITAHDCSAAVLRTLDSAQQAVAFLHQTGIGRDAEVEVVVVDDGSRDDTPVLVAEFARDKPAWKLVRRERASSPSCARNTGVRAAPGDILFFLDGDDLFLPMHFAACLRAFHECDCDFVKTGVRLADPVHPDWKQRIEFSIVINLCARRRCHDFVGGFPDYHVFRRVGDDFVPQTDVFYKLEDQYYSLLLHRFFRGRTLPLETVEYCRYPGNGYDRQYAKFCRPFAQPNVLTTQERAQLRLCDALVHNRIEELSERVSSQ